MSEIVFIGAGNLATHLATELYRQKHRILQVYSRTEASATSLAKEVEASFTTNVKNINTEADFYIFSVKDSVLEELIRSMPHKNGIWIHTAGSISMNIFENHADNYGVLYPFLTFSKNAETRWLNIPLFIEGINNGSTRKITELANNLSQKTYNLSSDKRKYVHASGVFACNFVNHMYELSKRLIDGTGLPFEILLPLIDETARKVHTLDPHEAQTGPAVRFDKNVMEKHLSLLDDDQAKEIYKLLSKSIYNSHKK